MFTKRRCPRPSRQLINLISNRGSPP
jgi:hypothetical protein